MNIITITLNPAYDVHYNINNFVPFKENYVNSAFVEAGGKGINVSRALKLNGTDNTAYIVAGRENCADFMREVNQAGLKYRLIEADGRIRENITIHSENAPETRISLDEFSINDDIITTLEEELLESCGQDTIIVFAGRVPKGVPQERILDFLYKLKEKGAKLAMDSNSFAFEQLAQIRPWLIKPNEQEIATFAEIKTIEKARKAAEALAAMGIENVIISMGGLGAAFACEGFSCIAKVPQIEIKSTIGAGDSTIAGFAAAFAQNKAPEECIKTAVSFGTAACLTKGTMPPKPQDIELIYRQIEILKN